MPWVKVAADDGSEAMRYERPKVRETNAEYFARQREKDAARANALRGEVPVLPDAVSDGGPEPDGSAGPDQGHDDAGQWPPEGPGISPDQFPQEYPAAPDEGGDGAEDGSASDPPAAEQPEDECLSLAQLETDGAPPLPVAEPAAPKTSRPRSSRAGGSGRTSKRAPAKRPTRRGGPSR